MNEKKAEEIFKMHFIILMQGGSVNEFKQTHPTLFKTIIESIKCAAAEHKGQVSSSLKTAEEILDKHIKGAMEKEPDVWLPLEEIKEHLDYKVTIEAMEEYAQQFAASGVSASPKPEIREIEVMQGGASLPFTRDGDSIRFHAVKDWGPIVVRYVLESGVSASPVSEPIPSHMQGVFMVPYCNQCDPVQCGNSMVPFPTSHYQCSKCGKEYNKPVAQQDTIQKIVLEAEKRVAKCILDDIDFGYDLDMIRNKIKTGSYVGNSIETLKSFPASVASPVSEGAKTAEQIAIEALEDIASAHCLGEDAADMKSTAKEALQEIKKLKP